MDINMINQIKKKEEIKMEYNPVKKKITQRERDEYLNSNYEVKTIIGLFENASINIYVLTKEEIDEFVEGYNEYDEFIVSVKKIK